MPGSQFPPRSKESKRRRDLIDRMVTTINMANLIYVEVMETSRLFMSARQGSLSDFDPDKILIEIWQQRDENDITALGVRVPEYIFEDTYEQGLERLVAMRRRAYTRVKDWWREE